MHTHTALRGPGWIENARRHWGKTPTLALHDAALQEARVVAVRFVELHVNVEHVVHEVLQRRGERGRGPNVVRRPHLDDARARAQRLLHHEDAALQLRVAALKNVDLVRAAPLIDLVLPVLRKRSSFGNPCLD